MKKIFVITLFPQFFDVLYQTGVVGSALRGERGQLPQIHFINPVDHSPKGFKGVDDSPYGGGAGQIMRGDVLEASLIDGIFKPHYDFQSLGLSSVLKVIYLGPRGKTFNQELAHDFSQSLQSDESRDVVFVCGRYEGIDERFINKYVESHLSIGDFVLSGGELALLPILDSIFRLMPGVLGNSESPLEESFNGDGIEFPQFTKPQNCCGEDVPSVLLSGNHQAIKSWRNQERENLTKIFRPELLTKKGSKT